MNSKILSFACLSLLVIFRSNPVAVAVEPEPPVPASVVAADRDFLNALESGAAVTPAPAQPTAAAPAQPSKPVPVTKKTATVKTHAPAPKSPKVKRTATPQKTETVEVRRAIPVERTSVVTTKVTRGDRDDDDDEGGWEESDDREGGFLSRLFSR